MPKTNQIQITPDGLKALEQELNELKNVKRPKIVDQVAYARDQGDLSENSAYIQGKEELNFTDGRISELEDILNTVKVVKPSLAGTGKVSMGNKVTVSINGTQHTFHVVGEWEADPQQKKISHESPLGKALLGKKKGDTVEVEAPAGTIKYTIVNIH